MPQLAPLIWAIFFVCLYIFLFLVSISYFWASNFLFPLTSTILPNKPDYWKW
uniref:ATP synthase F0 subunit 8 n=1 Tax=Scutopus robustus TaxID=2109553 RepID=A0A343YNB2_9MOLL|nr:ATP synthase F0 subunit 8 [Scutopus robustus]AWL21419.1 ATP synthase F0 subunit 8 [Scutopus robustus]